MCGRISQYSGIHDFVAAQSMPNALVNSAGEQPSERYNAAPTAQLALFHQEGQFLHADMVRWGWRPHWAKDRAAPINAMVEKVANGSFFFTPNDGEAFNVQLQLLKFLHNIRILVICLFDHLSHIFKLKRPLMIYRQ